MYSFQENLANAMHDPHAPSSITSTEEKTEIMRFLLQISVFFYEAHEKNTHNYNSGNGNNKLLWILYINFNLSSQNQR